MLAPDHPAVASIVWMGTPQSLANDVEAAWTLWALKIEVSTPALLNVFCIHLLMVSLDTDLCGFLQLMKIFRSVPLYCAVRVKYSFIVSTTQNFWFVGKEGKIISDK